MLGFIVIFFLLIILSMPIAIALGVGGIFFLIKETSLPYLAIIQRMFTGIDSFPLMAIPFFIIAGSLMNSGGITKRIIDFSNIFVGFLRGGLAAISIVGSMIFAGISGSSVADASGLGSILIPAMNNQGYDPEYSAAINATSSTVGIIIPPSIPMVILGSIAGISIRDLFMGGIIPGVLSGLSMLIVSTIISYKRKYPKYKTVTLKEAVKTIIEALPAIFMPILIIGGIISGIVTPTEVAVIAIVYAIIIGRFWYKELTVRRVFDVLKECGIQMSIVLLVISTASVVSWILSYLFIPQALAEWCMLVFSSKIEILLLIAITCLIAGTVIDVSPALILFGSVFSIVANKFGIDPIHYSLVLIFSLSIGLFTPPVGTTLIISAYIAKTNLLSSFKACLPFLLAMLFVLLLLILFPPLTTFLPNLLFG